MVITTLEILCCRHRGAQFDNWSTLKAITTNELMNMIYASIIVASPVYGWLGLISLFAAVVIFNLWLTNRHRLQLIQCLFLVMIVMLNLTEYLRLEYFVGIDVDPLPPSKYSSALDSYDSNLYWHHLIWFLTPILLLGVVLSNLAMLLVLKKEGQQP